MADPVEVAIEGALIDHLRALTLTPALTIAYPNVQFPPPPATPTSGYLRATFLPADSFGLGISESSSIQHYGLLQVDVFWGLFAGELVPARVASQIIAWFKRGTSMTRDGFLVNVIQTPYRRTMMRDDPWAIIPVRIPYIAFAPNPA
jgi:Bacteriophage related domain of unknown function